MSERAKLSFDDLSKPKKRAKPDLAVLRQLSEDHAGRGGRGARCRFHGCRTARATRRASLGAHRGP